MFQNSADMLKQQTVFLQRYFITQIVQEIHMNVLMINLGIIAAPPKSAGHFEDVEDIIDSFIAGNLQLFLRKKEITYYDEPCVLLITGYAGCGKTSLISSIAVKYSNADHQGQLYFISFTDWKKGDLSFVDIEKHLNETSDTLRNSVLFLDGLDEVSKTAEYK